MKMVVIIRYGQGVEDADKVAHRTYLRSLLDREVLFAAGPLLKDAGALLIVEAPTAEAVEPLISNDPYYAAGVIERWEILPLQYWSAREWKGK